MILKGETGEVEIKIYKRESSNSLGDSNPLIGSTISAYMNTGFKAILRIELMIGGFEQFYNDLTALQSGTLKEITFEEPLGLSLYGKLHLTGNVDWDITVFSIDDGTKLSFKLRSDNASIGHLADDVWKVLQEYPFVRNLSIS